MDIVRKNNLTQAQLNIIEYVIEFGKIQNRDVQVLLHVKESRSLKILKELMRMHLLERKGQGKGSYYVLPLDISDMR